jgi:hypothetical protein
MANLIPQKQVREVDNFRVDVNFEQNITISGSSTIAEDLSVGGNTTIEGSLFTSQSFNLGSNPNEKSTLSGSVEITGSLTIDGPLSFANAQNRLDATASYADEALNTLLYDGFASQDFQAQRPTLYVSSTTGNDENDGRTLQYPLRTIKRAAEIAEAGYDGRYGFDTGSAFNGYVIKVQAGTYLENNPVILPSNTTIWGAGLRITKINAQNPEQDLFWVNSGCYIAEVTVGGLRLWPDQINPERGFGFAFQPGAFITTSPYIQNCSQISNQENSFTELYEDIPPGGGGLYVNGDVVDPDSPLASMVLDAYTQISPNGVGCLVNGRGFIQLVSFFNNFSYYAIRVNNGGHATLNNSNISFGLFGMYASGSRKIPGSGGDRVAFQKVQDGWSVVVDVLNKGLDGLPEVKVLNTDAGIRATNFTQSFGDDTELNNKFGTTVAGESRAEEVWSDFTLVSNIVAEGPNNYPTLLAKSSIRGFGFDSPWNILGTPQITSSVSAGEWELSQISSSIGTILGIFADGTGSYDYRTNNSASVKIATGSVEPSVLVVSDSLTGSLSSSFETIVSIVKGGLSFVPTVSSNNSASIKISDVEQVRTGISSSFETIQNVSASFSIIYNILANGTGSTILDIPQNHKFEFTVSKSVQDGAYLFEGLGNNPTITLFRGETYKFNLDAELGVPSEPFYIRTQPISGFDRDDIYNYNEGVINNGDSVGVITFEVPYDAPNTLYYISQDNPSYTGEIKIVNNSQTPRELIASTLTYPPTILSSSITSDDIDVINGYDVLLNNLDFIKEETIFFLSSSWSGVYYNEQTCRRDIGFIVDAVAHDLLYGGNEESIRAGFFYYQYPSEATTTQLAPTTTAVKYISGLAEKLLKDIELVEPSSERDAAWNAIKDNKQFIENEVILYLSSSWSTFDYNEAKCRRDVGYILDAVATDTLYQGNERAVEAGRFYYLFPSQATGSQLDQTLNGIRYASGLVNKIVTNSTFVNREESTLAAVDLLRQNRSLIQDETIEFINVNYPQLSYNQTKCRRDVGFIIDAVTTDLLYGGNERSVTAGRYYYDYPSIATTTQKVETAGGIRYSRIIAEYIVQNIILETPRIITNDESLIKVTALNNITSSVSGTESEQLKISSSFNIVESIVKRGLSAIPAIVAKETESDWGVYNPFNVTSGTQTTSSITPALSDDLIEENWNVVTSIIEGGLGAIPALTSSVTGLVKVTDSVQISGTAASGSVTGSISSSFGLVGDIIINGTSSLPTLTLNTQNNIQVGEVSLVGGTPGTSAESASISQSMGIIINILNDGLSALPALTSSLENNIKVGGISQWTGSESASLSDISFISSSISIVTQIIETGNIDLVAIQPYVNASTASSTVAAYNILKENIDFIQEETIAYLSSSWRGFEYDEVKCRRDVGLIVSGAAEDLLFGANSASVVNGQFYYEYPSQATGNQLNQTLDGINYASRLAQKLVQNILFVTQSDDKLNAASLLVDNKGFIQEETILYISSSWSTFDYVESTCRRDVGYIIDAVATDLIYGGNERTRIAGEYYFLYPSEATDSQLLQTTDAINYASRLAQKISVGETFTLAETNKLNASNLILQNQDLIANEVVAYVSSSWSGVFYNQDKCKRDVKYILDAVRTDLVYGGNERTLTAGEFYYRFPSAATVAGVPSATSQLDPTITGIFYGGNLTQEIIQNKTLVSPTAELVTAANLVRENKARIQQNTIDFVADTYPELVYDVARCYRDVGFIVDGVLTDMVYGGNERSITSGYFYFKFPNKATTSEQVIETVGALNFAKDLTKLIAVGNGPIEYSFDIVARVIESGSSAFPTLVSNTEAGIKKTATSQITSSISTSTTDIQIISSSFGNVINIVSNGTGSIPTIVRNTERGVLISTGSQITSSLTPEDSEIEKVTSGFDIVLDIIENGTGSIPTIQTNASGLVKRGSGTQYITTGSVLTSTIQFVTSSFNIVTNIVENGTGSLPTLVRNTEGLIKLSDITPITSSTSYARSLRNGVSASYNTVLNIIENGTGSLPTYIFNTESNIKVTDTPQYISASSATTTESNLISESFAIVYDIIENGTGSLPALVENIDGNIRVSGTQQFTGSLSGSLEDISFISSSFSIVTRIIRGGLPAAPTIQTYVTQSSNPSTLAAYEILQQNIDFIQDETIAYLSSSWSTASYDESKCRRDVGFIVSASAEDLLWGAQSASVVAGRFYWENPSQAETSQLNQTIDGIVYASKLAEKLVQNIEFVTASSNTTLAWELLRNNREFIENETIAYISSSWSTHDYNEEKCKRDVTHIIDAVSTDLLYGGNERSINAGKFYYLYPSQATGYQLDETLDGVRYASSLSQKVVRNVVYTNQSQERLNAYELLFQNKEFIQEETIAYLSSSWSEHSYNQETCKRDVGFIIDAVGTDLVYGGNERSITAGVYYYLFPSNATESELEPTLTGIRYARNLSDRLLRGGSFQTPTQEKLDAYELLFGNKEFVKEEVISYISASWDGFQYNQETCKRDVGYIIDAVATDTLYGGNERSIEAGVFYYKYPSTATGAQLDPTITGIDHARNLSVELLQNRVFQSSSLSQVSAYNLLLENKELIQDETILYVNSAWSFFNYDQVKCRRDVGYIVDAVATDILYGGNERSAIAGEFYYKYPSLATVNNNQTGQLDETLDGVRYSKGIAEKIVQNILLETPSESESNAYDLLIQNKPFIQNEVIAFVSSSWSGVDGFFYNEASCSRDIAYITDAVATDLLYGGNERSSKAGEYYFLYPSRATIAGYASPDAQLDQTTTGIRFGSGIAQKIVNNTLLQFADARVIDAYNLLLENKTFIQDETIQFIDTFFPFLVYNRTKCRRDVGYIVDAVATDLLYGGNERAITAGDYYYRFPNKATTSEQVVETVAGVDYAKELAKKIVSNIILPTPTLVSNIDGNIKATNLTQYTSSISATTSELSVISSSFSIVMDIISGGLEIQPAIVSNNEGLIKVTNLTPETASISAGPEESAKISASFGLVKDIVVGGINGIPDALAKNFDYGFNNEPPTLLHIAGGTQATGSGLFTSASLTSQTSFVSSSYGIVIDIIENGLDSLPTLVTNTSSSLKVTNTEIYSSSISGGIGEISKVLGGFDIVLDVVENGVGVIPRLVSNTSASVKVTDTPQYISSSAADRIQARIISSSFSTVIDILQTGELPEIILSGSTPSSNQKINIAYDLLTWNKQMIIDETIQFMSSSWSDFFYNEASCSRDLGYIIDGAAKDLLYGGNEESVRNGEFYFLFPSEATGSQLDQTITAIKFASGISQKVVRNQVLTHISASEFVSESYNLLVNNKPFIQAEAIAYVSSSWSEFDYNEVSCSRDIGYIVDAVATDLLYGGNERAITAGRYYYDFPSQATDSQLEPTLTGIRYARGIASELVKGSTFQTSSADTQYAYDLLTQNKAFIQSESIAFVDVKYPHLQYNKDKCFRDTGYIVDAVATDLLYGGNEQSSKAGEFYYLFPSLATGVQLDETIEAVKYGARLAIATINSEVVPSPEFIPNTSASIKVTEETQTLGTDTSNQSILNSLSSSFGIVMDIIINGTGSVPSLSPYGSPSGDSDITNVYSLVKSNLDFIKAETIAYISSSWSEFPYNEASCSRDVGLIVSGAVEDLLHNSVSASYMNGYYYYLFPSEATGSQLQQTLDGIRYAARITDKIAQNVEFVTASEVVQSTYNLLRDNKEFIVSESIEFVSSSWSGFFYDQNTCGRDVRYIIDAVSTDLLYGGNERSKIAGEYYYLYPSTATSTQLDPTTTAIDYASGLAVKVAQNSTFVTASQFVSASVDLIRNNRQFIQAETIAYVNSSWADFFYNEASCSRDVGYIVDAVTTDLLYGGNQRSITAGKFYYLFPSEATTTQLNQTLDGVRWASKVTEKLVQNTLFVTASEFVSASFDLLRQNKAFIQAETIAYVSSSWSGVYYNEASCSRDVGYIVDAVATDLFYGGTERSITAGSYYYLYPSRATNAGVPSEQNQLDATTTGIKYAGRISKRVVTNPTFVLPSGSALVGRELLMLNKEFIQKETITFLSSSWSTLQYNEVSCSRDLGFILDAVATDMVYGGNERSVTAGTFYYQIPSVAIRDSYTDNGTVGQKKQTVDGINYAGGVSRKVVNKDQMIPPSDRNLAAYNRLLASREELKERALGYTNGAFPYLVYNEASCSRDTGLILDAVATDLLYGGNERAIEAASSYYNGQYGSAEEVVLRQRTETLETNRYLRTLAQNIAANPPEEDFGSLIVATGIDYSYNGAGVTFKALPPNQGGTGVADPTKEITELAGGRIFFTSGNESGDFRIGTGLTINQATGTLVGRTFSKSLFSLVTPFSLALEG